ncbi:hypothetical protein KFK09_028188 [Dendrobium nobile]|uniref:Uncharacterized protein n=1 Tax=Dendrobium nobile TaxID=94219 RepID=A0A8T3A2Q0_DENNO|nr:hypothetical protein KFK09_028188 [Dendrobium nobile]
MTPKSLYTMALKSSHVFQALLITCKQMILISSLFLKVICNLYDVLDIKPLNISILIEVTITSQLLLFKRKFIIKACNTYSLLTCSFPFDFIILIIIHELHLQMLGFWLKFLLIFSSSLQVPYCLT